MLFEWIPSWIVELADSFDVCICYLFTSWNNNNHAILFTRCILNSVKWKCWRLYFNLCTKAYLWKASHVIIKSTSTPNTCTQLKFQHIHAHSQRHGHRHRHTMCVLYIRALLYDGWIELWLYAWAAWMLTLQPYGTLSSCVSVPVSIHMYFCAERKIQTFPMRSRQPPDSWRITWRIVNFSIPQSRSFEMDAVNATLHRRRRRQRFSLRMFSIFLCCFLCLSLFTVRFAFTWWNFHNKSEQNKSDNSVYDACSARSKKDCAVFASYYTTYLAFVHATKTYDFRPMWRLILYFPGTFVDVCDAMRYFLWFCAVAKPMIWPTVN